MTLEDSPRRRLFTDSGATFDSLPATKRNEVISPGSVEKSLRWLRALAMSPFVVRSGLFDRSFYTKRYPDVAASRFPPLMHYLVHGWRDGRCPNLLFDTSWYLERNPDVRDTGMEPLYHFVRRGHLEARDPHPLFSTGFYLENHPDVRAAGVNPLVQFLRHGAREGRSPHPLFQTARYVEKYPDAAVAGNALLHDLDAGARLGHDPHPLFDTAWYLETNPDVARAGINPLYHFLRRGHLEGRDPHPLFSTAFYLETNRDVFAAGVNPLVHYVSAGEGRDPHPLFAGAWYLAQNPDVRAAAMNPLAHFLCYGAREGRSPHPLFLTAWYLKEYPDAAASGNALLHYLKAGAKLGHDPHPLFDTVWYLEINPDVARAGINPLMHYLRWGASEGRNPNPFFDARLFLKNDPEARASGCPPLVYCVIHGSAGCDQAHRVAGPAVLIIDHRFPMPDFDSGSVRMDGIIDAFLNLGYAVTFVSDCGAVPHAYRKRLAAKGVYPVVGIDSAVDHLERQGGVYSAVLVSRPGVGTRYLMAVHAHAPRARILYDTVDLHWLRYLRTAAVTGDPVHLLTADDHQRRESYCIGASDVTIAITEDEKRNVESTWPGARVEVIHNIHRTDPLPVDWERRSGLVFIGGFEHEPNCDAMIWFVQSILPLLQASRPGIVLAVLGSRAPQKIKALASESVAVVGYVPRVEPHFGRARLFISPLRVGAGMKGKIGQAMSLGLPVVTTPVGAEGMSIVDGHHALIAADAATFAAKILTLHDDFTLWMRLRENALRLVDERFSPQAAQITLRRIMREAQARPDAAVAGVA